MFSYLIGGRLPGARAPEKISDNKISQPIPFDPKGRRQGSNIVLPPFPTKVILDYDPEEVDDACQDACQEADGNLLFPIDDLAGAAVTFNSEGAPVQIIQKAQHHHLSLDFSIPSEEEPSSSPLGAIEAHKEIKNLRQKYHAVIEQRRIEHRAWEGVVTCYVKIWNEVRRRAKIGLNYVVFFVYNDKESCVESLEKLLYYDSFTVVRLPCKGKEAHRLYIAFDVNHKDQIGPYKSQSLQ